MPVNASPAAATIDTSSFWIRSDDAIRLRVLNSAANCRIAVDGRILGTDGVMVPFSDQIAPTSDRLVSTKLFRPGEGWLLGLSVRAVAGAPRRGQTFVMVELVRGFSGDVQPLGVLLQGYVTETSRRAWPGSDLEDSTDGRGWIRSITGTNPAAAVEVSETVPVNARWRLIGWVVLFTTDANVANRVPRLQIDDGVTVFWEWDAPAAHPASQAKRYVTGATGVNVITTSNDASFIVPPDLLLMGGFRIRTSTISIQAGDEYGAPQLLVEEWIEI